MLGIAKKYILSFPKDKEKQLLDLMKEDWQFEVIDNRKENDEIARELQDIDYAIFSVDFAISYLSSYCEKESILNKIKNSKIIVNRDAVLKFERDEELDDLVKRVVEIEKDLKNIEKDIKDQEKNRRELDVFGVLSFAPKETQYASSFVVRIDKQKEKSFKEISFKKFFLKEIKRESSKISYSLIVLKEKEKELLEFLRDIKADIIPYGFSRVPRKEREHISSIIKENEEREGVIKNELKDLADRYSKKLKVYHDVLCLERRQLEVKKRRLDSSFLNYIVFFAPEEEKEKLEMRLPKGSKIVESKLLENEIPPVYMKNNRVIEPFESVTNIFGLPSHKELDPTPYLSVFFIIFFGICITDAGYGLLLALFTGLTLILFKERFGENKLIKLLFYGGISTFIAGILFGSYFGVSPEELHISFMKIFKVIDPIKDTILFMGIAFFLGYLQICFSQIVKMIKAKKNKEKQEFLSGLAWFFSYIFLGLYILIPKIAGLFLILSFIGLFLVESKGQKIILKPLVAGIKILQGLINSMSDILSYSRLMALGLGTGVIALIVNQIAFLLGGMIPYVGWILTGLILIGGHLFNLGINALGGFIHSARLQFVEFFPKFMEGGGKRLDPIGQELKYIKINN